MLIGRVHGLAIVGTADVAEASAAHQTTRRFEGMVDRREYLPLRIAAVDRVVVQRLRIATPSSLEHLVDGDAFRQRGIRQLVDRLHASETDLALLDDANAPSRRRLQL